MPAPYPFGQIFAADPSNPENVARGGEVLIFAPGDPGQRPLLLWGLDGASTIPNPVKVNSNGFGPVFMANLPQVAWAGAGFTGTYESYGAVRDDAELSRIAAETAAEAALQSEANTTAPTDEVVNTVITNPASTAHLSIAANIAYAVDPIEARISNIDNTADADKPVSNATQAALNGKISQTELDTATGTLAEDPATATGSAVAAVVDQHIATPYNGPLGKWGAALKGQATRAAVWVSAGSSTANGGNASTPNRRWLNRLSARLTNNEVVTVTAAGSRPATGVQIYTCAAGGTNSANYLTTAYVTKLGSLKPDLMTHMIGSNDMAGNVSPAIYKANVLSWINKIRAVSPGTVHVLIHQHARYDLAAPAHSWASYGAALAELARTNRADVVFVNLSEEFEAYGPSSANRAGYIDTDKIHLNNAGSRWLADATARRLGLPDIGAVPIETFTPVYVNSGAQTTSIDYATIAIPARPYLRQLDMHFSIFAGHDTGAAADIAMNIPAEVMEDPGTANVAFRVSVPRMNNSASRSETIKPNMATTVQVRYNPNGNTLYLSGSPAYRSVLVTATPI